MFDIKLFSSFEEFWKLIFFSFLFLRLLFVIKATESTFFMRELDYCIFFSITISVEKKNKIEKWWQTRNFKGGRLIVSFHLVECVFVDAIAVTSFFKDNFSKKNIFTTTTLDVLWVRKKEEKIFLCFVLFSCVSIAPGEVNWFVLDFENVFFFIFHPLDLST
jgi:hypothetical protein